MNHLNPKSKFVKSEEAKRHRDMVVSDAFHSVLTDALAQMQLNMPLSTNPAMSWDNQNKMEGAKMFISILLNFGEEEKPITPLPSKALNPNIQPPKRP
jgi:hypothetical protein